ncbi:MAG: polysaccharide pyruvyl transferase family protein [Gemmatimonadaceae bacterium]
MQRPASTDANDADVTRASRENPDAGLIETLNQETVRIIADLVPVGAQVALLDFARHFNVGDAAIWLGEMAALSQSGVRARDIRYMCDLASYDESTLRRSVGPNGVILFHGGGNFGDLWPGHQQFRESIVAAFPDRRIVILPQSIHFRDASSLHTTAQLFNRHPSLTILARDTYSLELLQQHFKAAAHLCPDMAFCIGPLAREKPDRDIVYMARADQESVTGGTDVPSGLPPGVQACDWPRIGNAWQWRVGDAIECLSADHPRAVAYLSRARTLATRASYNSMAKERVAAGCRLIGHGRVMVADRLHAHILAVLMGIPHVVLDNSYGKITRFHQAWTSESRLTRVARTRDQAFEIAYAMVRKGDC